MRKRKAKSVAAEAGRSGATKIYTDGSCLCPGGSGGWAFVCGSSRKSESITSCTNNRAELIAAIEAMKYAISRIHPRPVDIYTDSMYVQNSFSTLIFEWSGQGWKKDGIDRPNVDLMKEALPLIKMLDIQFFRVAGHSGHPQNELCDKMAKRAARRKEKS